MWLTRFGGEGFRNLAPFEIELDPGINLFHGDNGAGKTSLLEAVFFLSRARSFRTSRFDRVRQRGSDSLSVFGTVVHDNGTRVALGLRKLGRDTEIRVAAKPARRVSELARQLPVMAIGAESHRLLEDGPELRRRFLDWAVFHMEHPALVAWRAYEHALAQRNAAIRLRQREPNIRLWHSALGEHGTQISNARMAVLSHVAPIFGEVCARLLPDIALSLEYRSGLASGYSELAACLDDSVGADLSRGYTQYGPHRAEIIVRHGKRDVRETLSRGQQKLVVSALLIAQALTLERETGKRSVLLYDDLPAELDAVKRAALFNLIQAYNGQVLMTAIDPAMLPNAAAHQARVFHVEQGRIRQVV
ncbi:MAG: DNA replication/repair protein RecF [Gammaproteobacteria bacterium]|nr:DNA replication/repair protein RecF [Gammaproteobacteria bacterium]